MKKIIALLLTAVLLLGCLPASAEEADKYEQLNVGTVTPFSGNFLSDTLGNNITDQDVRILIHGYSLVYWDSASGSYQFNRNLVSAATISADGLTYTFALAQGMTYNDGTPITARDYAFTLLLLGSSALQEAAGSRQDLRRILGGTDYNKGMTNELAGFRLLGDYQFSLTIDAAYTPYFYQLKALDINPLPISAIAPGCEVKDNGNGAYISGPFSAELLRGTLLDPETGYISHPGVTCGPYSLTEYDGTKATLSLNEAYIGDAEGNKPTIPQIIIQADESARIIEKLSSGELDLAVRSARLEQIQAGLSLMQTGDFAIKAYSRAGLSFISFCAEKGPTADQAVRHAIAMCIDKQAFTDAYLGAYGTTVKGYYGIGQWMFMMANGTLVPEEGAEEEWADLTLDNIVEYSLDPEMAGSLLDVSGWNLNEAGEPYDSAAGGIRYKAEGGEMIPLKLKLIYPEGNGGAALLQDTFAPYLSEAGIGLETEALPMAELLEKYYGRAERDCDMILLGTNFGDVFDPSGEYDEEGKSRLNGVTDPRLAELAVEMRSTEPGDAAEYCRRWLAYQEYRSTVIPEIPLYSDAYVDIHISALQNYEPGSTGAWAIAIQKAFLSDFVEEETEEDDEFFLD